MKNGKKMRKKIGFFVAAVLLFITTTAAAFPAKTAKAETVKANELTPTLDTVMESVTNYILENDTNPDFNSCWNAVGLLRSGFSVPQTYCNTFYNNVLTYLKENNWDIAGNKYSEYSKLIIALTAIGRDARNVEGQNLLFYLSDFRNVKKQGINGPAWALIALHCHPEYEIPENASAKEQTTEEGIIQYILEREMSGGGWALSGKVGDSDITGMVIQALSSYYGKRNDVTAAVDRALTWLSSAQLPSGGFQTLGVETSESASQVIVALTSIGIDPANDSRFVKNGKWPMTGLFQYYLSKGGFMHVLAGTSNNGGGEPGKLDGMATEQGLYACVAYKRLLDGKTALYDMSDVAFGSGDNSGENSGDADTNTSTQEPTDTTVTGDDKNTDASTSTQPSTSDGEEDTQNNKIKVIGVTLDYSVINLKVGNSKTLKATVTPSNADNTSVKWKSSNKSVAAVNQKGKVTGKKAGTAKITATSKDGTKIKAVCEVKVTAVANGVTQNITKKAATKKVTLKSNQNTAKGTTTADKTQDDPESAQEGSGWTFEAAEYVPETEGENQAGMTDEALKSLEEKLMTRMDGLYLLVVGLYVFDKGIMFLSKKRKNKKG